ncbi:MAG: hypothetical protein ACK4JF_10020 [Methylohalobius sp.]
MQFGKTWLLLPSLLVASVILGVAILGALWPFLANWLALKVSLGAIAAGLAVVVLDQLGLKLARGRLARLIPFLTYLPLSRYSALRRILLRAVPLVVGTAFVKAYLKFINPLFLKRGRLANLSHSFEASSLTFV